jgi:hypothetical protein
MSRIPKADEKATLRRNRQKKTKRKREQVIIKRKVVHMDM